MKKKKIRVYLQYPWVFPDSPYYKYLIKNPAENVIYLNIGKQKGVITKKRKFWFSNWLKQKIRDILSNTKLTVANAHKTHAKEKYDLIHCAHCLSKNNTPWICDFESAWQLYIGRKTKRAEKKVRKILNDSNCKAILPWTKKTKDEIIKDFPEVREKLRIVYPAIPSQKRKKKKGDDKINILFSGRYFFFKGGFHALEVIDRLTRKYKNVYGLFISEIPEEFKRKYEKNKKITFFNLMPQEEVFKVYEKSDIFLYPGYADTFGFGFLEAMSFGLPVVTVDGNSRDEVVSDNKTGFIVRENPFIINRDKIGAREEKIIQKLGEKASQLIENKKLREKMSKECQDTIEKGKFSIKKQKKDMKQIYEKVLLN